MKLRVRRPSKTHSLVAVALAGAAAVLTGVARLFGFDVALVLGGVAAVAFALIADAD